MSAASLDSSVAYYCYRSCAADGVHGHEMHERRAIHLLFLEALQGAPDVTRASPRHRQSHVYDLSDIEQKHQRKDMVQANQERRTRHFTHIDQCPLFGWEMDESKSNVNSTRYTPRLLRMRRLSTLYEPNSNNDTVCQDVCRLAAFVCLVLGFAEELGLHLLRALDLHGRHRSARNEG